MNMQFMVKDSKKYAATGGWGFADFKDGKPADKAVHEPASLPRTCERPRLCLHPLRTLIPAVLGITQKLKSKSTQRRTP